MSPTTRADLAAVTRLEILRNEVDRRRRRVVRARRRRGRTSPPREPARVLAGARPCCTLNVDRCSIDAGAFHERTRRYPGR